MPRMPRFLPCPGCLVEITQRTIQGRFLLRPSRDLNSLVVGVLGRAQRETHLRIHGITVLSNHLHLLASPETVEQVSNFMGFIKTNLSKEVGRLHDWSGAMFDRRYTMIAVSDEEQAQIRRLEYLLEQGCKEGLVASPHEWPGVHCANALLKSEPLRGIWIDRSRLWVARQREAGVRESNFVTQVELRLDPLPCWKHLGQAAQERWVAELIGTIERATEEMHHRQGTEPLGAAKILEQHPHRRSGHRVTTPRPLFHAFRKRAWREMRSAWAQFLASYREAAGRFRSRKPVDAFPENSFPPRPKFIRPTDLHDSS